MMDECLDEFFFSSSWSDENVKDIMSELCPEQPNEMLLSANGVLDEEYDNNHSHTSMINSNGSSESLAAQDASSVVLGTEADYGTDMIFNSGEVRLQEDGQFCFGNPLNGMANGCLEATKIGCQYNTPTSNLSSLNLGSLEQLPAGANFVQYNTAERSVYQRFNQDFHSPNPQFCTHPPFEGVSSISPGMGQDIIEGFRLQAGDDVGNDLYAMENHSANLSASASSKGKQDMHNHVLSSFASGPQMTMAAPGLSSLPQTTSAAPSGECTGTGKPRARARRGQATDPHSIAERLRREKIAERMKSLQELLPNPNKTDKASMLDEIIEYVKFLQLQVKQVLSMSRLGAAEAVAPLITSGQAEGANGLSLSRSTSQIGDIVFPSDDIAFERELVKLMESNVTKAMQYLQTKGFCLMPMALASAISAGKEKNHSSSTPLFEDLKRNGFADHPARDENDIIRNSLVSSDGDRNPSTESSLVNKCVGPVTELKPKI